LRKNNYENGVLIAIAGARRSKALELPAATSLARLWQRQGRKDDARQVLDEIQSWFTEGFDSPDLRTARKLLNEPSGHHPDLGMRPLIAHCHLGLGKLYRRTGQREQAHEHLTTATTMYREMGMTYWLEQAEAEMRASE